MTEPNQQSSVVIQVCTTCRAIGEELEPREHRAGARLFAALSAHRDADDAAVAPVECFSVCRRPCTVAFSAPGAWTYLVGDFSADMDPQEIFASAKLYGASPQGIIPWKQRPQYLKSGLVARLPPCSKKTEP